MFRYPDKTPVKGEKTLSAGSWHYARFRLGMEVHTRVLFLKEHTIIMGVSGEKFMHFHDSTVRVHPSKCIVIKRGIYAISELLPGNQPYQNLLLFFTDNMLQHFLAQQKLQPGSPANNEVSHLVIDTTPLLQGFREQYLQLFNYHTENPDALLQLKMQELFLLMLSGPQRATVLSFFQGIAGAQPVDIAYIVNTHLFQPVTIAELAKLSGRSLASFKRDFQQQYHCAPKKWINEQRLAHAHSLLQHSPQNVSEIALTCGYENVPHFIRIFKQEYGVTPNTLRAKKAII